MMEIESGSSEESDLVSDLKREIAILKRLNKELNEENEKLSNENKTLRCTINQYDATFKMHNDHVNSLRDLAAQDREWLDLKISHRQSQFDRTRKKTAELKRRASTGF